MTDPTWILSSDGPADADTTLILSHGAGAPVDHPFFETVVAGLAAAGLRVLRFEFPYMQRRRETGRRGPPDRMPVLEQHWRSVIEHVRGTAAPNRLLIGGKSMGGRVASHVADGCAVDGLVCFGYPFHPAGKPERLRTEHLAELSTPTLILQGERDALGHRAEVESYRLSPAIELHWLPDGDHSLKPRKRSGHTEEGHLAEAVRALVAFAQRLA